MTLYALKERYYQKYSIKYIYNTSQILKLSLILHTFSITGLVASLFLIYRSLVSSLQIVDLVFSLFYFSFLFSFHFIFYFLFLEQPELGLIGHTVTSVTTWWHNHKMDHETWGEFSRRFKNKWHHTTWTPHVSLMDYTWLFRVGCTVVSIDQL